MTTSKLLKLTYSISLFFIIGSCFSQKDSLPNHKNQFLAFLNFGLPVYNKFNISQFSYGNETSYWVQSKLNPIYNAGFEYSIKKFNIGLSASYIQNEFTGNDFEYSVFDYNTHSANQIKAKYNVYQKVNYNVFQVIINTGLKFEITPKHILYTNILLATNLIYNIKISNYYSQNQLGYDTTKYTLMKNSTTAQNYGKWPSFGFSIAYNYKITKRLILDFKIVAQYFSTKRVLEADDYRENGIIKGIPDSRDRYNINKHTFIAPTIGIKYKLK